MEPTLEDVIEQLQNATYLIGMTGTDYLDKRDLPMLKVAINGLSILDSVIRQLKNGDWDSPNADATVAWLEEHLSGKDLYQTEDDHNDNT